MDRKHLRQRLSRARPHPMPVWPGREFPLPAFTPAAWESIRVVGNDSWEIAAEERAAPIAIVPAAEGQAGEQEANARLIAAAPVLFMAAASMLARLEEVSREPGMRLDTGLRRAMEQLRRGLDLARGRG